jgi:hypothetical protein
VANTDFYPFEAAFETSDFTEWTSTVDTQPKMTVDHFIKVVNQLGKFSGALPYKGAYTAHIDLSVGTTQAYMETTAVTANASDTLWVRFLFQATSNLVMATSDRFTLLSVISGAATDEATVGIINNAGTIQLICAETGATAVGATTRQVEFSRDEWHVIELGLTIDSGGTDGTIQFWVDGYQQGTTITGLSQAAITRMRLGATGIDAGTTAGHLLFDSIVQSTSHEPPSHNRYPQTVVMTKSGFVALGPGRVAAYTLEPGGAVDNHLSIHDLDRQPLLSTSDTFGPELTNTHAFEPKTYAYSKHDGFFNRGCYVRLTGTAPRAVVVLGAAQVGSGLLRQYAMRKN